MIEFTKEEKDFLKRMLISTPLQGNAQTLPKALERIDAILRKLKDEPVEVLPEEEIE